MRQLTGLDAAFLHMEDRRLIGHVATTVIVDPSTSGGPINADVIRDYIAERIGGMEPLRWRLVNVPLGLDLPYWVDDPNLDLDFHVRGLALPAPGNDDQLAKQVARLAAIPLDRAHPLWEVYVIEGLAKDRVAIMSKMHHAAIDGKSGMRILATLMSPKKDAAAPPAPRESVAEAVPSEMQMLAKGISGLVFKPGHAVRLVWRGLSEAVPATRKLSDVDIPLAPPVAPRLPFNQTLSARRTYAFGSLDLNQVKAVKNALGVSVNDVVLAVCSGAVRRWLIDHDALAEGPALAMVPVSVRPPNMENAAGNQVTSVPVTLATDLEEPLERLRSIHEGMQIAKTQVHAVPASLLLDVGQLSIPLASEVMARVSASMRWADRVPLPFNVIISNVPGPRQPLYFAGGLVEGVFPVSMISDGMGLNITLNSYLDHLDFGLVSTPELMPDLWKLMDYLRESLDELTAAVGIQNETSKQSEVPRKRSPGRQRPSST